MSQHVATAVPVSRVVRMVNPTRSWPRIEYTTPARHRHREHDDTSGPVYQRGVGMMLRANHDTPANAPSRSALLSKP